MLDAKEVEKINTWLIKQLITTPFPYSATLEEQIAVALYAVTITPSYYCVHFRLEPRVSILPDWLDAMPLSWQLIVDEEPLLCQLFVKEGYIERLEIIDLTFNGIKWDKLWTATPLLDYEYNIQHVTRHLTSKDITINKVLHIGGSIDFAVEMSGKQFVASFRGCQVRRLMLEDLPTRCHLSIFDSPDKSLIITSNVADIDFDCALCFIQWHKLIG